MNTLTLIDKAFLLKQTPLFGELDLDVLLPIADKLGTVHKAAAETIYTVGETAEQMYIIAKGNIDILDHEGRICEQLKETDFFGDKALFHYKPRQYKAVCTTDAVLFTLSRTYLLTILAESYTVALGFLRVYSER